MKELMPYDHRFVNFFFFLFFLDIRSHFILVEITFLSKAASDIAFLFLFAVVDEIEGMNIFLPHVL